jgi:hypothetical protein
VRALAEGNSLRGTGRIVNVDKDTVCEWLDKAGRHCRAVTTYLFNNLHISECQLDELWSFVYKKEKAQYVFQGAAKNRASREGSRALPRQRVL